MSENIGKVVQVIGSTLDAEFEEGKLPAIFNALVLETEVMGEKMRLVSEVQQHLGGNRVRAVALSTTDGLSRGIKIVDTGAPIQVPVGEETIGRIFNLLGEAIDKGGSVDNKETMPITFYENFKDKLVVGKEYTFSFLANKRIIKTTTKRI